MPRNDKKNVEGTIIKLLSIEVDTVNILVKLL